VKKPAKRIDKTRDDIRRLERIKQVIYQFLTRGTAEGIDELKPKTYNEAVKCYLEVDSRIDEKRGKPSASGLPPWEKMLRRYVSSSENEEDEEDI